MIIGIRAYWLLYILATTSRSFSWQRFSFVHNNAKLSHQLHFSGYLAPELDPEYKNMIKKGSFISKGDDNPLPLPSEGDIVEYPGKWLSERSLGLLRSVELSNETWMGDVLPLVEGKSNNFFCIDVLSSSSFVPVTTLSPVKAYFVRSENGYNVSMHAPQTDDKGYVTRGRPLLRASTYRQLDLDFVFPRKAKVTISLPVNSRLSQNLIAWVTR